MASMEDKISSLLSSPEAVEQLMSVVKSLASDSDSAQAESTSGAGVAQDSDGQRFEPAFNPSGGLPDDLGGILSKLTGHGSGSGGGLGGSGIDPKMMSLMMKLLSSYSSGDDDKARLLYAIKPYIRSERQEKIDKAIQIVRLAKVAKVALGSFGGGDEVV